MTTMGLGVKKAWAIGAAAFLTLTISAHAELLVLTGPDVTADTMIRKASPDENFDFRFSQVVIQKGHDRYLLRFDLSALPKGSTVHSAVLELTVNNVWAGGVVSVRGVTEPWTETGATWNTRDGWNAWIIPGGSADSTNAARVDVQAAGRIAFDVRRMVQEWAGGTANHGFLVDMEDASGWAQIACRESEYWTADDRPRLTVEYSLPTVVLTGPDGIADTMLRKSAPDENFDHRFGQMIIQRNWDKCVFRFDLSGVPAGSTIHSARLELTVSDVWTGGVVKAARLLEPWSEVFATWNSRNGEHAWLVAGGASDPSSAVAVDIQGAGRVSWDVGGIVQQWADGAPNHGFHVYFDDGAGWAQIAVRESEYWVPAEGPALIVQYAPPTANPTVSLSGPEHTEDTMIRLQSPDENFDHRYEQVIVQRNRDKYLLRFNLSDVPQNAVIDEVTLYFTVNNVWTGGDMYIRQALTPWVEAEATWNSAAAGVPWGEGGLRPGEDYAGRPLYTLGIYAPGRYFVSLRDVVQRWVTGLDDNCGLLIDMGQGQAWWQAALRESEYSVAADRPRLDVTYHEGPPIDTKNVEIRTGARSIVSPAQLEGTVGFGAEIVKVDVAYGECRQKAWGARFLHTAESGRPWFMGLLDDLATRPERFDAVRMSKTAWYADNQTPRGGPVGVALHPCQPTEIKVWTEADEKTIAVEWVPTDLTGKYAGSDRVVIRKGDSLLLTASGKGGRLEIDADGDGEFEAFGKPGVVFANRYDVPGVYTVAARIGKEGNRSQVL